MRFIVPGSIASALAPTLVPCFRGLGLVRFGSLGLIALGCAGAMNWIRYLLPTANSLLTSPLSCRWRSDWLPCHPSQSIGGIHDRRFHFLPLPTDQRPSVRLAAGNFRNCTLQYGGDRRCPFVGCITVAACSARCHWHQGQRKQNTGSDPDEVNPQFGHHLRNHTKISTVSIRPKIRPQFGP